MNAFLLVAALLVAEPQPQHKHCWHEQGGWVQVDDVCCHCGVLKGCVGHGPFKPGCRPPLPQTFPYLLKEPETY